MRWKQFLTPVDSISADEARAYLAEHPGDAYTLLDVRQPKEYDQEHLPGSQLIPLPELADRLKDLDRQRPVLVYCAIGGRSRVAAQLLAGQGFQTVYNLKGGIKAWQGHTATGPVEAGMMLFDEELSPEQVLVLAYGMEEGLESFYRDMSAETEVQAVASLFAQLVKFEENHKMRLFTFYQTFVPGIPDRLAFERQVVTKAMEGGMTAEEFRQQNASSLQTPQDVLDIAMMIEAQALDLYTRYAVRARDVGSKSTLFKLAEEEKTHLQKLGLLRDTMA